jgi:hypothetical protein
MQNRFNSPLGPGPSHIHNAVQEAIELYATRLLALAKQNNGGLREADIRDAIIDATDPALTRICAETWSICLATAESMHWSTMRKSHFGRIMVECFAHLLPRSDEVLERGHHLSRRIIPGFLNALHQILGDDAYSQNTERTNMLVDTLRAVHGDSFSWDEVYADPICQTVVEDVLISIAHDFADIGQRRNWMIDVIDTHMPATSDEAELNWKFDDNAFHAIMDALYGDLHDRLDSPDHRTGLEERHGAAHIADLTTLFDALKQDHAALRQGRRL